MTTERIIRLGYAAAVGWLATAAYDWWGLLVGVAIVLAVNLIGILLGNDQ